MKTIAFFNNKGGVGRTSLVYHLTWMFAELGVPTLAVDLDPQANLTAMFLEEDRLEELWPESEDHPQTVYGAVRPMLRGVGDIAIPEKIEISSKARLLAGDLGLSSFEDELSSAWPRCHTGDHNAFLKMTAFYRLIDAMAQGWAEVVLIDVGSNLGAINRAALIASDHVCVPLAPDLYSLQGLRNLGPTLAAWRSTWNELKPKAPKDLTLPQGSMTPTGYVVMPHSMGERRPIAYQRWLDKIPLVYRSAVLSEETTIDAPKVGEDPYCLSQLRHYRSLMPLAMEAHKPVFHLKPADGAIGAYGEAVKDCRADFALLAKRILTVVGLEVQAT